MPKKINKLLKSLDTTIINKRLEIKCSVLDTGVYPISVMIVVKDLLSKSFKIKFFKTFDELDKFVNVLYLSTI